MQIFKCYTCTSAMHRIKRDGTSSSTAGYCDCDSGYIDDGSAELCVSNGCHFSW